MLLGDLITAVQEKIPIKIAVFNNSSLGFVELEMKVEGLLDAYTNLENTDFARVAQQSDFMRSEWSARKDWKQPSATGLPLQGRHCSMS